MRRIRRRVQAVALGLALALGACGTDEAVEEVDSCSSGNSYGVGLPCTRGGGECAGQAAAFCTVDFEETDQSWCTRPCDPDADVLEQCGEDAVCRGETGSGSGPSGCVPITCL